MTLAEYQSNNLARVIQEGTDALVKSWKDNLANIVREGTRSVMIEVYTGPGAEPVRKSWWRRLFS